MNEQMIDNPNALDQYRDLLGEEGGEFIVDIIDTFLADVPNNFSRLNHSMITNDFSTFRRAAHTLKTGCSIVGATALAEQFQELEKAGAAADLTSIGGLLEKSKADYRVLEIELEQKKARL